MKKILAFLLIALLLLGGCKPPQDEVITSGEEDGGGTGYGAVAKSVLQLSDFFFVVRGSLRSTVMEKIGSAQYSYEKNGIYDEYILQDGSEVCLQYSATTGALQSATYAEGKDAAAGDFFAKLVALGVLKSAGSGQTTTTPGGGGQTSGGDETPSGQSDPSLRFETKTHRIETFDQSLTLYMERAAVLTAIGLPAGYTTHSYKKDGYIIDYYTLTDGRVLLLDYGYQRQTLRGAVLKNLNGSKTVYLGSDTAQSKPADFARPVQSRAQFEKLKLGMTPETVYRMVGDVHWLEGNATHYKDAYRLNDGSVVYLDFSAKHDKLISASIVGADGQGTALSLS